MMTTTGMDQVVTLRGDQELTRRAGHLFASTREEFICAATDQCTWAMPCARDTITETMRRRRLAGVAVHKMFNPGAVADPADTRRLHEVAAAGVQVRICAAPLAHETIIIDSRVAILAGPPVDGVRTYSVVRSPEVVHGLRALFWSTWASAVDLAEYTRQQPPQLDEQSRQILLALAAGRKDETAARELGLSLRTYRRRVAELMTALGAESRFQAGVRARELGI